MKNEKQGKGDKRRKTSKDKYRGVGQRPWGKCVEQATRACSTIGVGQFENPSM